MLTAKTLFCLWKILAWSKINQDHNNFTTISVRFILSNTEKIDATELIRQAKEEGLLDPNVTTNCSNCSAIFPNEYIKCPQCGIKKIYHLKYK